MFADDEDPVERTADLRDHRVPGNEADRRAPREPRQAAPGELPQSGGAGQGGRHRHADAGPDPLLAELVKIRISQLNGCAFCLRMHTRDALAKGETSDRLAFFAAWWESQYFTAQEQAALAPAEQVTSLTDL
ncbi:MAG: carboxymuconolactone decarboxylase family protein, partial [Blastococcus sp.]